MFEELDTSRSATPPPAGESVVGPQGPEIGRGGPSLRGGGGEPPAVPADSLHASPSHSSPSQSQALSSALESLLLAAARARLTIITTLEKQLPTIEDPIEARRTAAILLRATSTPLIPIRKDPDTGLYEALQRAPRVDSQHESAADSPTNPSNLPSASLRSSPPPSAINPPQARVVTPIYVVPPKPPRATPTFLPDPALEPGHIVQSITDAFRLQGPTQPDTGFVTLAAFIDEGAIIRREAFLDSQALRNPSSSEADFELHLRNLRWYVGRNALDVVNENTGSRPIAPATITGDTARVRQEITSERVVRIFEFTLLRRPDSRSPNAFLITNIQWVRHDTS